MLSSFMPNEVRLLFSTGQTQGGAQNIAPSDQRCSAMRASSTTREKKMYPAISSSHTVAEFQTICSRKYIDLHDVVNVESD
jgi:hypothetical protein